MRLPFADQPERLIRRARNRRQKHAKDRVLNNPHLAEDIALPPRVHIARNWFEL